MDFVRLPLSRDARAAHLQPEPLRLLCLYTEAALLARLQRRAQLPRPTLQGLAALCTRTGTAACLIAYP